METVIDLLQAILQLLNEINKKLDKLVKEKGKNRRATFLTNSFKNLSILLFNLLII